MLGALYSVVQLIDQILQELHAIFLKNFGDACRCQLCERVHPLGSDLVINLQVETVHTSIKVPHPIIDISFGQRSNEVFVDFDLLVSGQLLLVLAHAFNELNVDRLHGSKRFILVAHEAS